MSAVMDIPMVQLFDARNTPLAFLTFNYLGQSVLPTVSSLLDLAGNYSCVGGHTMTLSRPTLKYSRDIVVHVSYQTSRIHLSGHIVVRNIAIVPVIM